MKHTVSLCVLTNQREQTGFHKEARQVGSPTSKTEQTGDN